MSFDSMAVQVTPGEGLVARYGSAVMVVTPSAAQGARVEELLVALETASHEEEPPGRRVARRVAAIIGQAYPEDVPALCLVGEAEHGLAVVVHGDMDAHLHGPGGAEHLSGRQVATWVDRIVETEVTSVTAGPSGQPQHTASTFADLREGVVPGAGFSLVARSAIGRDEPTEPPRAASVPPPATPPPAAGASPPAPPERSPRGAFEAIELGGGEPDEVRSPLPIAGSQAAAEQESAAAAEGVVVEGVLCSRDHFNDPSSPYCAVCGISMVHLTHNRVEGVRPPLGVLVLDSGATFNLEGDYVIGREPEQDELVSSDLARPLMIDDPEGTVSRVHAVITLDGWEVKISDRGSTNGTFLGGDGAEEWIPLLAGQPTILKRGARVRLGQRVLTFDSHHRG